MHPVSDRSRAHGTRPGRLAFPMLIPALLISAALAAPAFAQDAAEEDTGAPKPMKLFETNDTLKVTLTAPWRDLVRRKEVEDPYPATLEYTDELGQTHTHTLTIERRGRTRQMVCKYPGIKMVFDEESLKGSTFRGQEELKMVTHCDKGDRWEQYYIKEMLAYRMYNLFTERSFRVRPLEITYVESGTKSAEPPRFAFLIEEESDVAKRNGMIKIRTKEADPKTFEPAEISRYMLFQLMISNVDWEVRSSPAPLDCCHNTKLIALDETSPLYGLPFDFDSSGYVNTHYAAPNEGMPIANVTQRLFRGFCMHNETLEPARQEFLAKEQDIYGLLNNEARLSGSNRKKAQAFLGKFFDILRDQKKWDKEVIQKCRRLG